MLYIINILNRIFWSLLLIFSISYSIKAQSLNYKIIDSLKGEFISKKFKNSLFILESKEKPENHIVRLFGVSTVKCKDIQIEFGILIEKKFIDLDNDGFNDLILKTVSGREEDLIFLYSNGCFQFLKLQLEGEVYPLNNSHFCTYKSIGCADNAWSTSLYCIRNKIPELKVKIIYDGCEKVRIQSFKSHQNKQNEIRLTEDETTLLKNYHSSKDITVLQNFWSKLQNRKL